MHFDEMIVDVSDCVFGCGLNEYLIVMIGCLVVEKIALEVLVFGVVCLTCGHRGAVVRRFSELDIYVGAKLLK